MSARSNGHLAACALLATLGMPASALAEPVAMGPDFQVNSYTLGFQWYPDVAASPRGDFVIVWGSEGEAPGQPSGLSIGARRFGGDGTPLGQELRVNEQTSGFHADAAVSFSPAGTFLVAWAGADIRGRLFSSGGSPLGIEQQVNSYQTTGSQRFPDVAGLPDGTFVVVWESEGSPSGAEARSIGARRLGANGEPVGEEYEVSTVVATKRFARAEALRDGTFVVAWWSYFNTGGLGQSQTLNARPFDLNGSGPFAPLGVERVVAGGVGDDRLWSPTLAPSIGGRFVVAWAGTGSNGGILGRQTTWALADTPEAFSVTSDNDATDSTAVAAGPGGEFVVTWENGYYFPGYPEVGEIFGRRFDSNGEAIESPFVLNSHTTGSQQKPALASLPGGDFVATWWSSDSPGTDTSGTSVQARLFGTIDPDRLFTDGFESGDMSRWSEQMVEE